MDRFGRIITALFILVFGGSVVWLALPRVFSGLYVSNYGQIYDDLSLGTNVGKGKLALAAKGHKAALQWLEDGRLWSRLGEIYLAQAKAAGYQTSDGQKLIDSSIQAERNSLKMKPAQPYAWTQYAYATLLSKSSGTKVDPLLRRAIKAGPYEPKLVMTRIELGFAAWPDLSAPTKALLRSQIRLAAKYYPDRLARATKERHGLRIVRAALRGNSKLLRHFAAKYIRL